MSEAQTPPRSSRRAIWIGAVTVAAALAGGAGWYGWLWTTAPPAPPELSLAGLDPAVADAIGAARRKVLQQGRSAATWGEYGKVLRAHEFFEAADVCFAQAERLDSNEPRWPYYQGLTRAAQKPDEALPFLRRAADLCDKHDRGNDEPRLRLAETLLQTGAYADAEEQLKRVQAWDPDNPRLYYDLGVLAEARQDDEAAVRHFTASAKSPYGRQKSYSALARIAQRQGHGDEAADYGRRAAAPPDDRLWDDRYVGDYERLEAGRRGRFQQAERLEAEGRLPDALPILIGLAEDTSDARAQIAAGVALDKMGRFDEAERYLRTAVGLAKEQAEANYSLAATLFMQGEELEQRQGRGAEAAQEKYKEVLSRVDKALELTPDHAMAYLYRGNALKALGRRKQAIAAYREAVLRRPEIVEPHLQLARALDEADRKTEADAEWRRVLESAPPADPARREALSHVKDPGDGAR